MSNKITKDDFVAILQECGISDEQMKQFHQKLEARFPEDHERLLGLLNLPDEEIEEIRQGCC